MAHNYMGYTIDTRERRRAERRGGQRERRKEASG